MYSGNLGLAHSFNAILDSAEAVQHSNPELHFVFVGAGAQLNWVKEQSKTRHLANITFLPPQPLTELSASLAAADIHLVSMRENLSGLVVPSKAYGIFAAGRPCFFIGPCLSEIGRLIIEHECGQVFGVAESSRIIEALRKWSVDSSLRVIAGERARRLSGTFTFAAAFENFHRFLQEVTRSGSCSSEGPLLALQQMPSSTQK